MMPPKTITNNEIKAFIKLKQKKYRDLFGLFIVEGKHLVEEAQKANLIKEILTSSGEIDGIKVSYETIKKLSTTKTPQEVIAICHKKQLDSNLGQRVLFLNNIQDPGNLGTLIRAAKAFNWTSVVVQGVDIYNPKVLRSSQGALFKINILQVKNLSEIETKSFQVLGASLSEQSIAYDEIRLKEKLILVLGNEGNGIDTETKKLLNQEVIIPISFESLNVAQAGAILLNEFKI